MARKDSYLFTINNPLEHDIRYDHEQIKFLVNLLPSVTYWCMSDEIGNDTGTYHTHVYVKMLKGVGFERIKDLFPHAHVDFCKGTQAENREYVSKTGKWEADLKHETQVKGSFFEEGEIIEKYSTTREKLEAQDIDKAIQQWIEQIENGTPIFQIVRNDVRAFRYQYQLHKYKEDIEAELMKQQEQEQFYIEEQRHIEELEKQAADKRASEEFERRWQEIYDKRWEEEDAEKQERKLKQKEYRNKGKKKSE